MCNKHRRYTDLTIMTTWTLNFVRQKYNHPPTYSRLTNPFLMRCTNLRNAVRLKPATKFGSLNTPEYLLKAKAGKAEHVLAPGDIPVIQSDRGY